MPHSRSHSKSEQKDNLPLLPLNTSRFTIPYLSPSTQSINPQSLTTHQLTHSPIILFKQEYTDYTTHSKPRTYTPSHKLHHSRELASCPALQNKNQFPKTSSKKKKEKKTTHKSHPSKNHHHTVPKPVQPPYSHSHLSSSSSLSSLQFEMMS